MLVAALVNTNASMCAKLYPMLLACRVTTSVFSAKQQLKANLFAHHLKETQQHWI